MNGSLLNVNVNEAFDVPRVAPHAEQFYEIYPRRLIEQTNHNKPLGYNDSVGAKDYERIGTSKTEWTGFENNLLGALQFEGKNMMKKKQPRTIEKLYTGEDVINEIEEDKPTGVVEEVVAKRGADFTPTRETEINNVEMNNNPEREDFNTTDLPVVENIASQYSR